MIRLLIKEKHIVSTLFCSQILISIIMDHNISHQQQHWLAFIGTIMSLFIAINARANNHHLSTLPRTSSSKTEERTKELLCTHAIRACRVSGGNVHTHKMINTHTHKMIVRIRIRTLLFCCFNFSACFARVKYATCVQKVS